MADNSAVKELKEKLMFTRKNGYERTDEREISQIMEFAEDYKAFLDSAKTEREAVVAARAVLEAKGIKE